MVPSPSSCELLHDRSKRQKSSSHCWGTGGTRAIKSLVALFSPFSLARHSMSKDLEEGEIEDGELLDEVADMSAGNDVGVYLKSLFFGCWFSLAAVCCLQVSLYSHVVMHTVGARPSCSYFNRPCQ